MGMKEKKGKGIMTWMKRLFGRSSTREEDRTEPETRDEPEMRTEPETHEEPEVWTEPEVRTDRTGGDGIAGMLKEMEVESFMDDLYDDRDPAEYWPLSVQETSAMLESCRYDKRYKCMLHDVVRGFGPILRESFPVDRERFRLLSSYDMYRALDMSSDRPYDVMLMLAHQPGCVDTVDRALHFVDECDRAMASMPDREGLAAATSLYPLSLDSMTIRALSRGWTGGNGTADQDRFMARLHNPVDRLGAGFLNIIGTPLRIPLEIEQELIIDAWRPRGKDGAPQRICGALDAMMDSGFSFTSEAEVVHQLVSPPGRDDMMHPGLFSDVEALPVFIDAMLLLEDEGLSFYGENRDGTSPIILTTDLASLLLACAGFGDTPAKTLLADIISRSDKVGMDMKDVTPTGMNPSPLMRPSAEWPTYRTWQNMFARSGYQLPDMQFCGLTVRDDRESSPARWAGIHKGVM